MKTFVSATKANFSFRRSTVTLAFPMPSNGRTSCHQTATNKIKEINKSLLRCQSRQSAGGFYIVGTMAIMLSFPAKSLVGLVTSYFTSITVLCVLPKTKEV